ncbi:hypothetical protein [Hymenobacter sp. BT559]|uniref:hypothetical protein n=1 Tax=Hymenobacter sp. BT559 TaxID=2795729 RepID=UPI0018EAA127|nr:hypothetical protein [Hymenobacter sp. BT559]MBJ6143275.1 hypothetical protein [Hymenobacter sp. BT559]
MRSVLLAGFLLAFAVAAQAQNAVVASAFGLRPSAGNGQHTVELGASKSQVIKVLGQPTKTSRFYSEIDEKSWPVLHYGSNKLYFNDNQLALVELNDARLTVGKPGASSFRVGSVLPRATAKPTLAFGNFKVERKPGKSRNLSYSAISHGYMKTEKGEGLDVLYEIQYDQQGRVTHIALDSTYD